MDVIFVSWTVVASITVRGATSRDRAELEAATLQVSNFNNETRWWCQAVASETKLCGQTVAMGSIKVVLQEYDALDQTAMCTWRMDANAGDDVWYAGDPACWSIAHRSCANQRALRRWR